MTLNLPKLKVFVKNSFVTGDPTTVGFSVAYLVSARIIETRPILFGVHFEDGAYYSDLPLDALRFGKTYDFEAESFSLNELQPWGCISSEAQCLVIDYFKNYRVLANLKTEKLFGRYLFTIDYHAGGFSEDPEQYKAHHIIALENGYMIAFPNNYLLFIDYHFTKRDAWPDRYRRNQHYYLCE